nr:MAG TPA: Myoactive tetradecapeptides family [Bacteriophage sp.]
MVTTIGYRTYTKRISHGFWFLCLYVEILDIVAYAT